MLAETTNKTLKEIISFVKDAAILVRPCSSGCVVRVKLGFLVSFWWGFVEFALPCRGGCAAACSSCMSAQGALRARRYRPQALRTSEVLWGCAGNIQRAVGMHQEQPQCCGDVPGTLTVCTDSTHSFLYSEYFCAFHPGEQQAACEPAVCPGAQQGQCNSGVH